MKTLRMKSSGKEVEELTSILQKRGYLSEVSNYFNLTIRKAVEQFQAAHVDRRDRPLSVDGIVGPLTWWALRTNDVSNLKFPSDISTEHKFPPQILAASLAPGNVTSGQSTFGELVLAVALEEMEAGAREKGANNSGAWVEKYLNGITNTPANWCAGFVSYCYQTAAERANIPMPYRYSLGAKNTFHQFRRKGWNYKASDDSPPEAGDIIVWHRGNPKGWTGHIGLVHHYEDGITYTVEGNKGSYPAPVRIFTYTLDNIRKLYGFGRPQV